MKKRRIVGLLVALLAIPAIALAVAQATLAYESNQFQQGAAADFAEIKNPTPDQQRVYDLFRKLSLQQFCGNPSLRAASELESVCSEEVDPLVTITTCAETAGIVGLSLIFAIAMFGLLARSSRTMQGETGSRSVNIAEDSDWTSDADSPDFIELLTTMQVRNYASSNPDLQNAFTRVLEVHDSPGEMGRQAADFITQVRGSLTGAAEVIARGHRSSEGAIGGSPPRP